MITITEMAADKLKGILDEEGLPDAALRVIVVPNGNGAQYMLTLESEQHEDDVLTEIDGVRVLIDADSAPIMEGAKIDYIEDLMRSGFIIDNPNIAMSTGGCGCGGNCSCGGH